MNDREWFLLYGDVPEDGEDPTGDAYNKPCASCFVSSDFIKTLKDKWNEELGEETLRVCNSCGNTELCKKVRDCPLMYSCGGSNCQSTN